MNSIVAIIDFATALLYSALAYEVGMAYTYTPDPRWTAEQQRANRQTIRASYAMMGLAVASGALIVPMAITDAPFRRWPWWCDAAAALSAALVIMLPWLRRMVRDVRAQRYRLIG